MATGQVNVGSWVVTLCWIYTYQWRNRFGGQGGRMPPETSDWEISADLSGKERQGKKGEWEEKRRKIEKGKVEN